VSQPPELPDLPAPEELRDRLSHTVAVLTVVTTLAAAVVGYLVASASRGDDLADLTAQRHAVRANGRFLRAQHRAQVDHETFVLADEQRRRAAAASQEKLFAAGQAARGFELDEARWNAMAERTQELTSISEAGPDGPQDDPAFPVRFFARHRREPVRLAALQDAANQESSVYEGKVAQHTAVITLFAVALYLFGLSFTMQPRVRRMFAGVGTFLLTAGLAWAGVTVARPVNRAPQQAADAYADAHVALETAASIEDYRRAERLFTRAIGLRPDFARAHVERADAAFLAGSPQRTGFASITRPRDLRRAIADLRAARELGTETVSVLGSLGFYTFAQAMQEDRPELLEESVAFTGRALELEGTDPVFHFNLAVALLADGRPKEAREAYAEGVRHVLYTDVRKKTLRGNPSLEEQWVAGALTDLELAVAGRGKALAEEALAMKELVVGSASLGRPGAGTSQVAVPTVEADLFPAEVQWRAVLEGYDEERDTISAQWYYRDPSGLGWAVIPEPSGVASPRFDEALQQHFDLRSFLPDTVPPRCFPQGEYRVELYVNGRLAGTARQETTFGDLRAAVDRDIGVGLCHPPVWTPALGNLPGLLAGWVAEDGSAGAHILHLSPPRQFDDLEPAERSEVFLDTFIDAFGSLFPATPALDFTAESTFFMGLDGALNREYVYEGGRVLAGAGVDDQGAVTIGLVFAPQEAHDEGTPRQVYDSLVTIE
jgi:tetratricopeptide (TPR) repeat protein